MVFPFDVMGLIVSIPDHCPFASFTTHSFLFVYLISFNHCDARFSLGIITCNLIPTVFFFFFFFSTKSDLVHKYVSFIINSSFITH